MDRRSWGLLVVLSAVWGASFLLTHIAIRDLSVPLVSLFRTGMAALFLLPIAFARGTLGTLRGQVGAIVVLALVQLVAPFLLLGYGQRHVDSGLAGVLVASTPLWTALLAVWLDDAERSRGWALAGIGVGIAGVALLLGAELGGSSDLLLGAVLLLLGAFGYALGGFLAKLRIAGGDPVAVVCGAMLAGSAVLAVPAAVSLPDSAPGLGPLAAAVALGALSGGLGWLLYYTVLARAGAARAAISMYLMPGFAVLYGVLALDEPFGAAAAVGLALVILGSWMAARRPATPAGVAIGAGA